jgi:hypothetical protein
MIIVQIYTYRHISITTGQRNSFVLITLSLFPRPCGSSTNLVDLLIHLPSTLPLPSFSSSWSYIIHIYVLLSTNHDAGDFISSQGHRLCRSRNGVPTNPHHPTEPQSFTTTTTTTTTRTTNQPTNPTNRPSYRACLPPILLLPRHRKRRMMSP